MKKLNFLKLFVLLFIVLQSALTSSLGVVSADSISPYEKELRPCISITNIDEFNEYNFYVIARGPLEERFLVTEDVCVTWYKFNSDIYIEAKSKINLEETAISKMLDIDMASTVSIFSSETGTQYNLRIDRIEGNEVYITQVSTESRLESDSNIAALNSLLPIFLFILALFGFIGTAYILIKRRKK